MQATKTNILSSINLLCEKRAQPGAKGAEAPSLARSKLRKKISYNAICLFKKNSNNKKMKK